MKDKSDKWLVDVADAFFDGFGELALASFNERHFLESGAQKIRDLEEQLRLAKEWLEAHDAGSKSCGLNPKSPIGSPGVAREAFRKSLEGK